MFILLFICWLIFNGSINLQVILLGIVIVGLVYLFLCKFCGWSIRREIYYLNFAAFFAGYSVVLVIEIIKAAFATLSLLFSSRYELEPVLVSFDTDIKSPVLRVLLANSITLTPGTITVSIEDNHYVVHALDIGFAENIAQSVFVKKLKKADKLAVKLAKAGKKV